MVWDRYPVSTSMHQFNYPSESLTACPHCQAISQVIWPPVAGEISTENHRRIVKHLRDIQSIKKIGVVSTLKNTNVKLDHLPNFLRMKMFQNQCFNHRFAGWLLQTLLFGAVIISNLQQIRAPNVPRGSSEKKRKALAQSEASQCAWKKAVGLFKVVAW